MPDRVLLHSQTLALRWGDMDALGHVNNIVYLQYFEEARVRWMTGIGGALDRRATGMILARTAIDYRQPLTWPGEVEIRHYAGNVGRASFTLQGELARVGAAAPACSAEFVLVWFDYQAGRSAPLPDWLRVLAGVPAGTP